MQQTSSRWYAVAAAVVAAALAVGCAADGPGASFPTVAEPPTGSAAGPPAPAPADTGEPHRIEQQSNEALEKLATIPIKGRAPKTGYDRRQFGERWTDDVSVPGGRNGCDTRNDILDRDLTDKTYVTVPRCPRAVATGVLRDPYTDDTVVFTRGAKVGAAVQIDHIVPLSYAWDQGARHWTAEQRIRFANDPANLIAVAGAANQDKGDSAPADWMPPNRAFHCQYALQFAAVLRGYRLPVDQPSADVLRQAAAGCPAA